MPKQIPQPAGGVRIETFVPWALVKHGAKKQIVTPDGAPEGLRVQAVEPRDAEMDEPELRALGLAHYWQHLLDTGKVGSLREIAAAEGMDLGQVSRIARLATGVVEEFTAGGHDGEPLDAGARIPIRARNGSMSHQSGRI